MSKADNLKTQQAWGEAVNSGNLEALRDLVTPGVVDHDPAPRQGPGAQGFIDFFKQFRAAFPDLSISLEHMVADDDCIALAYTVTGTHKGDFLGIRATGRKIKGRGVQVARFEDGKMAERWGSSDQLGILQQVGGRVV